MRKLNIKFFQIIGVSVLGLFAQGCTKSEVVDLVPEFSFDAVNNPSSLAQVEQVLLGTYGGFRSGDYYGSNSGTGAGWVTTPDVLSDNLYESATESLANSRVLADWIYEPSSGLIAGMYAAPYRVISRANIVLRDIDKFTTPATQGRANRIKGQALVIRALAHFDLLRYWATSYDRNSAEPAVAIVTNFEISTSIKPRRNTTKEVYDAIYADINAALPLLANTDRPINAANGITRPFLDVAAANALLARVNLYSGDWQGAITAATNAINARPLVNLNQAAFAGMYNQTNVGEIIWNVQFEAGESGPSFQVYFATVRRNYFRVESAVATAAGTSGLIQNNDIRYAASFTLENNQLSMTKYRGKGVLFDGNANAIVFRTGEMYLIRAEAYARNNQATQAMADLNTLRAARINGYVAENLSGQALLDAIANERRRELLCEGHRFFDVKRTTRRFQRGIECGNVQVSAAGNCVLLPTAREWTFPIPETETNVNENAAQNPGY